MTTTENPPIRVWKMNDCDWVAARTKTEAIDCYMETSSQSREEILEDDPLPLTDAALERLTFTSDEEKDEYGSARRHSFLTELRRLEASGATFPRFFASTEF